MASIKNLKAFNFQAWIEENKEKLKPPVGNAYRCGKMAR